MHRNLRILKNTTDLTADLTDFVTAAKVVEILSADALYIGTQVPITNLYFDLSVANSISTALSVSIWYSGSWVPVVDLIDETAGFTKSGRISWAVNRTKGWSFVTESEKVSGLSGTVIYDSYWIKINVSTSISNTTAFNYIGQKLCTEAELESYYNDLANTNLKASLGVSGSWNRKILMASENIVSDLISKRILWNPGQILDWSRFKYPCIHKTAEIIYSGGMGEAFSNERSNARKEYSASISMGNFGVDINGDGKYSREEKQFSVAYFGR